MLALIERRGRRRQHAHPARAARHLSAILALVALTLALTGIGFVGWGTGSPRPSGSPAISGQPRQSSVAVAVGPTPVPSIRVPPEPAVPSLDPATSAAASTSTRRN